jgi:5-methylcytosine-specific restriction enzyme subunit McrC
LKIPIQNIYYLLCYAWDKLEEGQKIAVSSSDYEESINLLGRVLVNGCQLLFKRGLERNYIELCEEYIGIKGKIDFKESLNKNLFKQGRSICQFDNFDTDILQNQLLKATLLRLSRIVTIDKGLRNEVWNCYWRFGNVRDISLEISLFSKIRIHRNNSFYELLLKISKLIVENTVLDEKIGKYQFKEFIGSEKAMARLFESFVRNFYKKEQSRYRVSQEDIKWDAKEIEGTSREKLPKMQTDITLESEDRKIIIDTKYYSEALVSRYDSDKFRSSNLYQLYSYLRNIENKIGHHLNPVCEGVLLYPTVEYSLDEKFKIGSHILRIKTVDLNKTWKNIKNELLNICLD